MNYFAKAAMILSLGYYVLTLVFLWGGQLLGFHNHVWDAMGLPPQTVSAPLWFTVLGGAIALSAVGILGFAYFAAWSILSGGATQDFRALARNLGRMAWGFIGFWVAYNIMVGALPLILTEFAVGVEDPPAWDPLDLDIIFPIAGVVLLAIAQTLSRAWEAEEENQQFL